MVKNLWVEGDASELKGLDELVYRSVLLGRDRSIANWGGGNTSMKSSEDDFRGRETSVIWIKGSGSDLATITRQGFAGLRLEDILPLLDRADMNDAEMTAYLSHCLLDPGMPRQSIETLMHAFLPFKHVDHTHPDSIISLATSRHGETIANDIFGSEVIWETYIRPGFRLARNIARKLQEQPKAHAVILAKHGLITWGDTSQTCYEHTLEMINRAAEYIDSRSTDHPVFGGVKIPETPQPERETLLVQVLPVLRGAVSKNQNMVLQLDQSAETLEFVNGAASRQLALTGAACPDHLVHTKYVPLWVEFDPARQAQSELLEALQNGVEEYAEQYRQYYEENKTPDYPMDDPYPRVILVPGVGMVTTGKDARMADVSAQLFQRAIQVMRGAYTIDRYASMTPAEAFGVEYWPLERYKLTLLPPERELARKIAFITGAASGIGRALARRFAQEGAHVVIADIDLNGAQTLNKELCDQYGFMRSIAVACDVTSEESVAEAFRQTILAYGGIDVVVSNAGMASAHEIESTTLDEWKKLFDVLSTGYFLVGRQAFRTWRTQKLGGNLIFIASKNALVPSKKASAYNAAKAAELHLARTLAAEGGDAAIRVNTICPDAIIQGSSIWNSSWREARAKEYGIQPDEIEEFFRKRSLLNVNVFPEDIAEAALFLASARSAKTTGAILMVDGGIPGAFVR
ncbi:MAG: bifunctional aldolase/short-chain dehydrogenase [Anaerolineaceae bacterium]|nr:bifunctional aldolase/short-chain dehydrogenase [Anaerolineaceae bacterium]